MSKADWESALWQRRHTIKNLKELKAALGDLLPDTLLASMDRDQKERATMSILITPHMVNTMNMADLWNDPLRKSRSIKPVQLDQRVWISVVRQPVDTIRPALLAACQRAGFTPDIAYETSDPLLSLHLVSAGLGLAVVQASLRASAPKDVLFRELPWLDLRVGVHLVWRADEQRRAVAAFRKAVLGQDSAH